MHTLKAMVRTASDRLMITCRSLESSVASVRNSSRVSPICRACTSFFAYLEFTNAAKPCA